MEMLESQGANEEIYKSLDSLGLLDGLGAFEYLSIWARHR